MRVARRTGDITENEALMIYNDIDFTRMESTSTRQTTSRRKVPDRKVKNLDPYIPLDSERERKVMYPYFLAKSYHLIIRA